jgi:DNA-binding response OmpR family regulator
MKILIIDDEPNISLLLREILTAFGYEVGTTTSGKEGLELIFSSNYSIVFSDYMMPDLSGKEIFFALQKSEMKNKPHFIMTTALDKQKIFGEVGKEIRILEKPFRVEQLRRIIESL